MDEFKSLTIIVTTAIVGVILLFTFSIYQNQKVKEACLRETKKLECLK